MPLEIERKFLVKGDFMPYVTSSERIAQGYLSSVPDRTVRVRIRGEKGYLTIKGIGNAEGTARYEWEKEIPLHEAQDLMAICEAGVIDKTRHIVEARQENSPGSRLFLFEVDVFHGANEGLVVAEIELESPEESFPHPEWLSEEVTGDKRYYNSWLAAHPFSTWAEG